MAKTWADVANIDPPAKEINRGNGEGPPRCCLADRIAADALVWYGGHPQAVKDAIRAFKPILQNVADADLYLCGGCWEHVVSFKIVTREDMTRGLGVDDHYVALAWLHDEHFYNRGMQSAPPEARRAPWWAAAQAIVALQRAPNDTVDNIEKIKGAVRDWFAANPKTLPVVPPRPAPKPVAPPAPKSADLLQPQPPTS